MDDFAAWIRWHGPYRTKAAWQEAANVLQNGNDRVRLYFAIGRWKFFSIAFSRPLYIGLNAKDSQNSDIAGRLVKHTKKSKDEKHYKISGMLNEYWLGEIMTRWHYCQDESGNRVEHPHKIDTDKNGLTSDVEQGLIFCLAPIINERHVEKPPSDFSFQIINEINSRSLLRKLFKTRFEQMVCGLYRYDKKQDVLICGDIKAPEKRKLPVGSITSARRKRKKPSEVFKNPFAYRVFGEKIISASDERHRL